MGTGERQAPVEPRGIARRLGLAAGGSAALLLLVAYLLLSHYRSGTLLRENLLAQRAHQAQLHAAALAQLFAAGQDDVRSAADSSEVAAYFLNRDLGMSMEYGLKLSLVALRERLAASTRRPRAGEPPALAALVLLDADGVALADSGEHPPLRLGVPLAREPAASGLRLGEGGQELLVTYPLSLRGRYAGHLVGWIRRESVDGALWNGGDARFRLLDAEGHPWRPDGAGSAPLDQVAGLDAVAPDGRVVGVGAVNAALLASRVPIAGTRFTLLQVDGAGQLLGDATPAQSALALGLVATAVLAGAVLAFAFSARAQVLRARLDESLRREEEVAEKNRALEAEMAERRRLQASHARLAQAVDQAAEAIALAGPGARFAYVNPAFERMTGWVGADIRDAAALEVGGTEEGGGGRPTLSAALALGKPWKGEVALRRRDGAPLQVQVVISPVHGAAGEADGAVMVARDVTEENRLREQLRHSQRLEAVGTLAGGVAHDFNNLLSVINGYANMVGSALPEADPLREDVEQILAAGRRAADLTRHLLAFGRRQVLRPEVVDLDEVVRGVEKMLRRLIPEHITLATMPGRGLRRVRVDPGQLEQVLVNLVVNARDAMPRGGRIAIATANVALGEDEARAHADGAPGEYVRLTVSDDGAGMDPATLSHIFEPFFTTKPPGRGTGLGLSTVYGIVRQSRGFVTVRSRPGHGSTFDLFFPASEEEAAAPRREAPTAAERGGPARPGETVLVVEDEAQLRALLVARIAAAGYEVVSAGDGEEALALVRDRPGRIDVLLSDVVMPRMSGPELARRFRALRPEAVVVLMTGYAEEPLLGPGGVAEAAAVIQKPSGLDEVAAVIRRLLDGAVSPGAIVGAFSGPSS